ncbi:MAG: hypothetical protein KF861_21785 [Planctomycetaceae bacterium]|nr:hypothetical protein [Planctomycetaceae bacterium]
MKPTTLQATFGIAALATAAVATWALAADSNRQSDARSVDEIQVAQAGDEKAPKDKDLSHFMRVKLDASGKILEGLAVEDFSLIKEGAQQLHSMSTAEKWRVTNDALYRQFSGDFQRITQELVDASRNENLDAAALKWMAATMSCIECHRYARGIMIADRLPQSPERGITR